MKIIHILFYICVGLTIFTSQSAFSETPRYALIASPETEKSGLIDLLTVRLSESDKLELVDRADIKRVMRELKLSSLSGEQGVSQRLQLGKILGADRLVVLQTTITEESSRLSLLIIDTETASTLFQGRIEKFNEVNDDILNTLNEIILDNIREYENGIWAIIAVPHFLVTSVNSDLEEYQKSFSRILSVTLTQQPGVAVVSLDEIEAIKRELDFSGKNLSRVVPLVIQGEFQAKQQSQMEKLSEKYRFDINVKIIGKNGVLEEVKKTSLSMAQIVETLGVEIPKQVLAKLEMTSGTALSLEEQEKTFSELAERFHNYGMYAQARTYRETVLLINPDNVVERLRWIRESRKVYNRFVTPDDKRIFEHLDYILRNRLVTMMQGASLIHMVYPDTIDWEMEGRNGDILRKYPLFYDRHLALLHFAPMIFKLPLDDKNSLDKEMDTYLRFFSYHDRMTENDQLSCVMMIFHAGMLRCSNKTHHDRLLDDLLQVLLISPECYCIPQLQISMPSIRFGNYPEQFERFTGDLRKSGREDLAFVADYYEYLAGFKNDEALRNQFPPSATTLQTLEKLIKAAKSPKIAAAQPGWSEMFFQRQLQIEQYYAEHPEMLQSAKTSIETKRSDHLYPLPFEVPVEKTVSINADFTVSPCSAWWSGFEDFPHFYPTQEEYTKHNIFNCDDSSVFFPVPFNSKIDIAWNNSRVFVCRFNDGKFQRHEVFQFKDIPWNNESLTMGKNVGITRVRGDGKLIWIATVNGITCVNVKGEHIAEFTEKNGLPEFSTVAEKATGKIRVGILETRENKWDETKSSYWYRIYENPRTKKITEKGYALNIYPIGPGDCLAFGRSGNNLKTWIARLSVNNAGKTNVKIILEASRSINYDDMTREEVQNDPANADVACRIPWISGMDDPLFPQRRQLLLGRVWEDGSMEQNNVPPLLLDLDTNEIMLVTDRYPELIGLGDFQCVRCVNGHLVGVSTKSLYSFDRNPEGQFVKTECSTRNDSTREYAQMAPWVFVEGATAYIPGTAWYALDCSKPEGQPAAKRLSEQLIPDNQYMKYYAQTANFGLCGIYLCRKDHNCCGHCGYLYQFDLKTPMQRDFPAYTTYLPESNDYTASHADAGKKLSALGAHIGGGEHSAIVVLDQHWKGNASDLMTIGELFRPRTLYIYDLTLSNDDVRAIDSLFRNGRTRYLYLINAGMTSDQLKLMDTSWIEGLWLYYDNNSGKKPTDQWISILYEPRKNSVKTDPFFGQFYFSDGMFSPKAEKSMEGKRRY